MPEEDIQRLLDLAMLSPTAFNLQNWRFVVVRDPALRQKIRAVSWNQAQVTEASLLVILCADLRAWEKQPERYWRDAPPGVAEVLVPAIGNYYQGREPVQRDEAMRSCGIAAQTLMLAARAMGYDSCPMDGFDFEAVGRAHPAAGRPCDFHVRGRGQGAAARLATSGLPASGRGGVPGSLLSRCAPWVFAVERVRARL